jgi:hypothetical protein
MAPQQAFRAQSGGSRTPHDLAEPNFQGGTRVHRRYFNGLLVERAGPKESASGLQMDMHPAGFSPVQLPLTDG